MSIDIASLEKSLIAWVEQWNEGESQEPVDADTNLSGSGLLDSMAVVGLISYLEEQADTEFDFGSYHPGDGVTIRNLIEHCTR
jgi:acyl carrier protein